MADTTWQPLNDLWETYTESLDEAIARGYINDKELAESYVWPVDLHIADAEQDDVKRYVQERMTEIVERIKRDHGLNPDLLAAYIFRSVLVAMLWEKERVG